MGERRDHRPVGRGGAPRAAGRPAPAAAALWYAIALTALAMSLHLPPVTALLAHVVPGAHWVDLTKHLLSIADGAAVLWFVLGAAGRQRHTPSSSAPRPP
ncbi:hypothetical protein ACFQ2B_01625 [Streptomyces stramineus]